MSRAAAQAANNQLNIENQDATNYAGQAQGVFNTLTPELEQETTNPQGLGAQNVQQMEGTIQGLNTTAGNTIQNYDTAAGQDITNIAEAANTASQQSIGGAEAGAVGQGNLEAARTGNTDALAPALDASAQEGMEQLSQNALGVQEEQGLEQLNLANQVEGQQLNLEQGTEQQQLGVETANAQEEAEQQQAGMANLGNLYAENLNASQQDLGMAPQTIQAWNTADQNTLSSIMAPFQIATNAAGAFAGVNNSLGNSGVCWIAEALWGPSDERVRRIRAYVNYAELGLLGRLAVYAYRRFGERVAARVRTSAALRRFFTPIFDRVLARANEWVRA
jgi:hypothetical protein